MRGLIVSCSLVVSLFGNSFAQALEWPVCLQVRAATEAVCMQRSHSVSRPPTAVRSSATALPIPGRADNRAIG